MMRLARRATLLVALFLLTSAATAHAEGAWMLWKSATRAYLVPRPGFPTTGFAPVLTPTWEPAGAFEDEAACQRALSAQQEQFKTQQLVCLPDTVDPRGPKGK